LRKGFAEFLAAGLVRGAAPRLYGAQADGCAPIVRLVERGGTQLEPEVPNTICRSLAIGSPADGVFAARAVRESGGWAAAVSDTALVDGIRFLAQDTGVFAETAGGGAAAAALALARAGRLGPAAAVGLCITGHGVQTRGGEGAGWVAGRDRPVRPRLAVRRLRGGVPRRRLQGAGRRHDRRRVRDPDRAGAGLVGGGDRGRGAGGAGTARPRARRRRPRAPVRRRRAPPRQRGGGGLRRRRAPGPGARGAVDRRSARGARLARVR